MKASELALRLQQFVIQHGDHDVIIAGDTAVVQSVTTISLSPVHTIFALNCAALDDPHRGPIEGEAMYTIRRDSVIIGAVPAVNELEAIRKACEYWRIRMTAKVTAVRQS